MVKAVASEAGFFAIEKIQQAASIRR